MDSHAKEFYSTSLDLGSQGHFRRVIGLHNDDDRVVFDWEQASKLSPKLSRGWFELAQLPIQDRIEFTREFWRSKLPYHPHLDEFLLKFFASLDDVGVFLTQQKYEDPYQPHLVYSLANNNGFFHGEFPAEESEIINLQKGFPNYILPADYLAFLQIHDGFAKQTDTGIIPSFNMKDYYEGFQLMLQEGQEPITTVKGDPVNPTSLIPFYMSFGMPFFQCFWGEWYPGPEMGNVYYSGLSRTISTCQEKDECADNAFQEFLGWLMFYLEQVD